MDKLLDTYNPPKLNQKEIIQKEKQITGIKYNIYIYIICIINTKPELH